LIDDPSKEAELMTTARGNGAIDLTDEPGTGTIRRICVIGGAGYVGSVLVERLLDDGYGVTVLDALLYGDDGVRRVMDRPGFELVRGDLRNIEAVVAASRSADAVVHLGALVGDPACELDEQLTLQINQEATFTAAAVARGLGIGRFVFASTCGVYGATDDLLDEESPVAPISLYAQSKLKSEELLLSMAGDGFHPTVLRFGTFYGRSPRERFDLVINLLTARAVTEGEININGGQQFRPFLHVADGAEAIIGCLRAPAQVIGRQVFNVGADDQNHRLADVAQLIAELVPEVHVRYQEAAAVEANYRVSFTRISTALGFVPRYSLRHGIAEVRDAVQSGKIADYTEARYSNVKAMATGQAALALEGEHRVETRAAVG
jgi:nucleoside-diphosphate-sugar epimerase